MRRLALIFVALLGVVGTCQPAVARLTNHSIVAKTAGQMTLPCRPDRIVLFVEDTGAGVCDENGGGTTQSLCVCNPAGTDYVSTGGSGGGASSLTDLTDVTAKQGDGTIVHMGDGGGFTAGNALTTDSAGNITDSGQVPSGGSGLTGVQEFTDLLSAHNAIEGLTAGQSLWARLHTLAQINENTTACSGVISDIALPGNVSVIYEVAAGSAYVYNNDSGADVNCDGIRFNLGNTCGNKITIAGSFSHLRNGSMAVTPSDTSSHQVVPIVAGSTGCQDPSNPNVVNYINVVGQAQASGSSSIFGGCNSNAHTVCNVLSSDIVSNHIGMDAKASRAKESLVKMSIKDTRISAADRCIKVSGGVDLTIGSDVVLEGGCEPWAGETAFGLAGGGTVKDFDNPGTATGGSTTSLDDSTQGWCVDLFDTGTPNQTTGNPDGTCDTGATGESLVGGSGRLYFDDGSFHVFEVASVPLATQFAPEIPFPFDVDSGDRYEVVYSKPGRIVVQKGATVRDSPTGTSGPRNIVDASGNFVVTGHLTIDGFGSATGDQHLVRASSGGQLKDFTVSFSDCHDVISSGESSTILDATSTARIPTLELDIIPPDGGCEPPTLLSAFAQTAISNSGTDGWVRVRGEASQMFADGFRGSDFAMPCALSGSCLGIEDGAFIQLTSISGTGSGEKHTGMAQGYVACPRASESDECDLYAKVGALASYCDTEGEKSSASATIPHDASSDITCDIDIEPQTYIGTEGRIGTTGAGLNFATMRIDAYGSTVQEVVPAADGSDTLTNILGIVSPSLNDTQTCTDCENPWTMTGGFTGAGTISAIALDGAGGSCPDTGATGDSGVAILITTSASYFSNFETWHQDQEINTVVAIDGVTNSAWDTDQNDGLMMIGHVVDATNACGLWNPAWGAVPTASSGGTIERARPTLKYNGESWVFNHLLAIGNPFGPAVRGLVFEGLRVKADTTPQTANPALSPEWGTCGILLESEENSSGNGGVADIVIDSFRDGNSALSAGAFLCIGSDAASGSENHQIEDIRIHNLWSDFTGRAPIRVNNVASAWTIDAMKVEHAFMGPQIGQDYAGMAGPQGTITRANVEGVDGIGWYIGAAADLVIRDTPFQVSKDGPNGAGASGTRNAIGAMMLLGGKNADEIQLHTPGSSFIHDAASPDIPPIQVGGKVAWKQLRGGEFRGRRSGVPIIAPGPSAVVDLDFQGIPVASDHIGLDFQRVCTDLYDTGGPPQTSGSPDGLCDDDGSDFAWEVATGGNLIPNAKRVYEIPFYFSGGIETAGACWRTKDLTGAMRPASNCDSKSDRSYGHGVTGRTLLMKAHGGVYHTSAFAGGDESVSHFWGTESDGDFVEYEIDLTVDPQGTTDSSGTHFPFAQDIFLELDIDTGYVHLRQESFVDTDTVSIAPDLDILTAELMD